MSRYTIFVLLGAMTVAFSGCDLQKRVKDLEDQVAELKKTTTTNGGKRLINVDDGYFSRVSEHRASATYTVPRWAKSCVFTVYPTAQMVDNQNLGHVEVLVQAKIGGVLQSENTSSTSFEYWNRPVHGTVFAVQPISFALNTKPGQKVDLYINFEGAEYAENHTKYLVFTSGSQIP